MRKNSANEENVLLQRDILQIEQIISELKLSLEILDSIIHPESYALVKEAFMVPDSMVNPKIKKINLPDLSQVNTYSQTEIENLINQSINSSGIMKTLALLKQAAFYSRLPRTYNLVMNGQIKELVVAENNINELVTQQEQLSRTIRDSFHRMGYIQKYLIETYKQYSKSKESSRKLLLTVLDEYSKVGTVDVSSLLEAVRWGMKFDLGLNSTQHSYLLFNSQIERMIAKKDKYNLLIKLIPKNQKLDRYYDKEKVRENERIQYDVSRGILDLSGL
jgi:hypothetical protein